MSTALFALVWWWLASTAEPSPCVTVIPVSFHFRKVNKCYKGRSCPIIVHCRQVQPFAWVTMSAPPQPPAKAGSSFLVAPGTATGQVTRPERGTALSSVPPSRGLSPVCATPGEPLCWALVCRHPGFLSPVEPSHGMGQRSDRSLSWPRWNLVQAGGHGSCEQDRTCDGASPPLGGNSGSGPLQAGPRGAGRPCRCGRATPLPGSVPGDAFPPGDRLTSDTRLSGTVCVCVRARVCVHGP